MSTENVVKDLKVVLADSYALYLKTQNYHWNVQGPRFQTLHALFEQQYTDLAAAIDEVAELIRALGQKAPGTWKAYQEVTSIVDGDEQADAETMLKQLIDDQDVISKSLSQAMASAQETEDDVVVDAMVQRMSVHRKNKWMLQSSL